MGDHRHIRSLRNLLGGFKKSDFSSLNRFLHSAFFGWIVFGVLVFAISLVLSFHVDYLPPNMKVGRVAPKDIKADQNYEIVDERATEINRQEAMKSVPPVFDFDENVLAEIDQNVHEAFQQSREAIQRLADVDEIQDILLATLGLQPTEDQVKALMQDEFSVDTEFTLRNLLRQSMSQMIVAGNKELANAGEGGITLRYVQKQKNASEDEAELKDLSGIKTLDGVQTALLERAKQAPKEKDKAVQAAQLYEVASRLVRPNLSYDAVETELRRARAVGNVRNVIIKVQAGEAIVRSGDRYEPHHLVILEGIRKRKTETSFATKFLGTALFVSILLLITYAFSKRFIRKFNPTRADLYFLGGVLILLLFSVRIAAALSSAFRDLLPFDVSVQALYYAIPVAAGAMLTRYILNSEIALVFAIVASALTGMFLEGDLDLSIYYLISSIVAASAIAHVERRSAILRAGVMVGAVNAAVVLAIKLVTVVSVANVLNLPNIFMNMGLAFLGGLLAAIFVMVLAPVAEMLFDYVTDIKLLELGNLNHPLLKEMIVKAPGTYHHSQLVAVLAEAAAAEIGANPLLARVGSYFHDVGKMRKPSYFIENQQGGENRHDKLAPSMSALIIASHVKDGLELAREYKLPTRIADFIPQHQGTKLITYFYNKAQEQAQLAGGSVDEKDYRYPGPRPQTREAGIILLADGVEAAVRSIPEKTPAKIQAMVQKIVNKNFTEAQLDECDMTLKDLHMIAESFVRVLVGIYHQRIEYPDVEEKKATVTPIKDLRARESEANVR
ncbi:HDIG domain-containing protein [Deltaproteobacteria bacterium PRO3]|nr:HDIG domain-containing protein [Deltaproteobacteria bacterium PRO3]